MMTAPRALSLPCCSLVALLLSGCSSQGSTSESSHGGSGPLGASGSTSAGAAAGGGGQNGSAGSNAGQAGQGGAAAAGSSALSPTVDEFMGINGFIDDDVAKLAAVGNVREYHDWTWNDGNGATDYSGYPNSKLTFQFDGYWDFDGYYAQLKAKNVLVFPCLQGSVEYLYGPKPPMLGMPPTLAPAPEPPVVPGADPTAPASYVAHAAFMYQYAARYGTTKVDASKLTLAGSQTAKSALDVLPYYEDGNEPDATWVHSDGSFLFTPEMTAAMASADYDGDQAKMGATFGIKSADPNAKLVLAGLAGAGPKDFASNVMSYLDGMRAWATAHRGGSFPADVINIHDYCFGPDPFGTVSPKPGLSPEACKLADLMASLVSYRDQKLPGKPLWLTEFGYDTDPRSRLRAPAIAGNSAQVVQGQWLVRSFLALMASGIDRAFLFLSRDVCTGDDSKCPDNAVQFSTSGVFTEKGEETPKAAWYFLAAFRARLGAMRYQSSGNSGVPNVSIAKFYDATSDQGAYVVWAPTSAATVITGYTLSVDPALTAATLVSLADKSAIGTERALSPKQGSVMLDVSETPSILLVSGKP